MAVVVAAALKAALKLHEENLVVASGMVEARGAGERAVKRVQKDILAYASLMEVAGAANILSAQRVLRAAQCIARHMVEERDVLFWAAPRGLKEAHPSARGMVEGSVAHSQMVAQRVFMAELSFV